MNKVQKNRIKNYRAWIIVLFIFPLFMPLLFIKKSSEFLSFVFESIAGKSDNVNDIISALIKLDNIIAWAEKNEEDLC